MSKKSNQKCKSGQIEKIGYHRKGYYRKEYYRKNGTFVPAIYINESNVRPTCIKDVGKPGKGPKILPRLDDKLHLSDYGYSIRRSDKERHRALRKASNYNDPLMVLRRLNLIRNYQYIPNNKDIFTSDVEYMKELYREYKNSRSLSKSSSKSSKNSRSISQKGGLFNNDGDNNDNNNNDNNDLTCDNNGICYKKIFVNETHLINGKQIDFHTLSEKDANNILKLDKAYLNPNIDIDIETVLKQLRDFPSSFIGISINGILEGYCHYYLLEKSNVKINRFCANKGCNTSLFKYMEKFFKNNGYQHITLFLGLDELDAIQRINFWYTMGFVSVDFLPETKIIILEKYL